MKCLEGGPWHISLEISDNLNLVGPQGMPTRSPETVHANLSLAPLRQTPASSAFSLPAQNPGGATKLLDAGGSFKLSSGRHHNIFAG